MVVSLLGIRRRAGSRCGGRPGGQPRHGRGSGDTAQCTGRPGVGEGALQAVPDRRSESGQGSCPEGERRGRSHPPFHRVDV